MFTRVAARRISLLILLGSLAGCSVYSEVPVSENLAIERGETVRVRTRDNVTAEFRVANLDDGVLSGGEMRIPLAEIERIEVRRFNKRVALITFGAIAGALLIIDEQNDSCTPAGILGCVENGGTGF